MNHAGQERRKGVRIDVVYFSLHMREYASKEIVSYSSD